MSDDSMRKLLERFVAAKNVTHHYWNDLELDRIREDAKKFLAQETLVDELEYAIVCAREERANSTIDWLMCLKKKYST